MSENVVCSRPRTVGIFLAGEGIHEERKDERRLTCSSLSDSVDFPGEAWTPPLSDPGTAGTVGIAGLGIAGAAARCQRAVAGSTMGTGPGPGWTPPCLTGTIGGVAKGGARGGGICANVGPGPMGC